MTTQDDISRDLVALKAIAEGIDGLRARMLAARERIGGRERGYLLPDEDDEVRRLFLGYRNYRIALYEILERHQTFHEAGDAPSRDRSFLLALGAALMLYDWSSTVVDAYRNVAVIREKLNEPDPRYGIEANLFERIYEALTSLTNLQRLREAVALFELEREALAGGVAAEGGFAWLYGQVANRLQLIKQHDVSVLRARVEQGWSAWRRRAREPFAEVSYHLTTLVMDTFGNIWVGAKPEIPAAFQTQFRELMQPGDFFIVRPERKSSTVFLPGWWTHCAFYHGGSARLAGLRSQLPRAEALWDKLSADASPETLEALSEGVVLNPLARTLGVDHAVAIRPRLGEADRLAALDDAFSHVGKPYDFEFDFTRSDRLVCTEVIYRVFHGKGDIRFAPTLRFGRPTLSADDIAETIMETSFEREGPFDVVAICRRHQSSGKQGFHVGEQAWRLFAAINRANA